MATFEQLFDAVYAHDKNTIQHILKFWEPRVRQFAPPIYLDHYYKQQAICRELKECRRRMRREFRAMNQAQIHDYTIFRNRFN
jgi:hypothetical protein